MISEFYQTLFMSNFKLQIIIHCVPRKSEHPERYVYLNFCLLNQELKELKELKDICVFQGGRR